MCFDYEEQYEFYTEKITKARKRHSCDGCCKGINPGELYKHGRGQYEGHFDTLRTCGACELDRYRIHVHELSEGCAGWQSWCVAQELGEALHYAEMECSSREFGQRYLKRLLQERKTMSAAT